MKAIVKYKTQMEQPSIDVELFHNADNAIERAGNIFKKLMSLYGYDEQYNDIINANGKQAGDGFYEYGWGDPQKGKFYFYNEKDGEIQVEVDMVNYQDAEEDTTKIVVKKNLFHFAAVAPYADIINAITSLRDGLACEVVLCPSLFGDDKKTLIELYGEHIATECYVNGGYYFGGSNYPKPILINDLKSVAINTITDYIVSGEFKTYVDECHLTNDGGNDDVFAMLNKMCNGTTDFRQIYISLYGVPKVETEITKEGEIEPIKIKDEPTPIVEPKVAETGGKQAKNGNPEWAGKRVLNNDTSWLGEDFQPNNKSRTDLMDDDLYVTQLLTLEYHKVCAENIDRFDEFVRWVANDASYFMVAYQYTDFSEMDICIYDAVGNWVEKSLPTLKTLPWWDKSKPTYPLA